MSVAVVKVYDETNVRVALIAVPAAVSVIRTLEQGPRGASGEGDKAYVHTQISASTVWSVMHNLSKYPSVTIVDSGGNTVIGDVHYESQNALTVTFSAAFGGNAYLN